MILEFWGKQFNNTYSKDMWLKLTLLWPSSSKWNWIKHVIQFFFQVFPLDYCLFVAIVLYFLYCTMSGIRAIGIRCCWIKVSF